MQGLSATEPQMHQANHKWHPGAIQGSCLPSPVLGVDMSAMLIRGGPTLLSCRVGGRMNETERETLVRFSQDTLLIPVICYNNNDKHSLYHDNLFVSIGEVLMWRVSTHRQISFGLQDSGFNDYQKNLRGHKPTREHNNKEHRVLGPALLISILTFLFSSFLPLNPLSPPINYLSLPNLTFQTLPPPLFFLLSRHGVGQY